MTNPTQNPDVTETRKSRTPRMLTILVDLSHPDLADGGFQAKLNIIEILKGCAKGVAINAEATIIGTAEDGSDPLGVFLIASDPEGESKAALGRAIAHVRELAKQEGKYATVTL